jgi:hypothetical protein
VLDLAAESQDASLGYGSRSTSTEPAESGHHDTIISEEDYRGGRSRGAVMPSGGVFMRICCRPENLVRRV